ncbi:MAG TPA: response regulator, partial [Thermoanaerobaculia bacterium]|nr:response regulator [Thermoanaerobaculia bacterium]
GIREQILLAHFPGTSVAAKIPSESSVLVVEDDTAIRRLVKSVLEREGYRVDIASDGLEAVLKLGVVEYDVIVLDLMMPNLDGFSFINTIAANDPARLKRVIVTSAASPSVIKDRLEGAPFRVLPKPFDIIELARQVRSCIDAAEART